MATTKTNVRSKLSQARLQFLKRGVKKTGKNMSLEFKYFELEDIIPAAVEIFAELGLVTTTNFDGERAVMTVYNTDDADEPGIEFVAPYREAAQIVSRSGNEVTNAMQALGSSITYLRRYLWMMVLDIVEADDIDANLGAEEKPAEKPKKPATVEERKEAKKELVKENADENASKEQIKELKNLCKKLLSVDESQDEFVQKIAMKTEGMTKVTAKACTALCEKLNSILSQYS